MTQKYSKKVFQGFQPWKGHFCENCILMRVRVIIFRFTRLSLPNKY